MKDNNSLETCRTSIQLERSNYLIKNPMTILSTYDPPCIELMAPINVDEKKIKDKIPILSISVSYATETFQKITNVRDFDVETLWSSAGGFVGIFLGYSLLQVPDLLNDKWIMNWKELHLISYIAKFIGIVFYFISGRHKMIFNTIND